MRLRHFRHSTTLLGNVVVATLLVLVVGLASCTAAEKSSESWPQWGGVKQDFVVPTSGLSLNWPDGGPKKIWERELGEGYSSIIVDGGRVYTMYRSGDDEIVIAMDRQSGETVWQYKYNAPAHKNHVMQFGAGPRSTPLLFDGRLYTIGVAGKMHCLDKENGKVLWSHTLWDGKEFDGTFLNHGYSSSVFPYKNTVIVMVGGKGEALVAFDKKDGHVAWKNQDFGNSYCTPKLINLDGEEQLLCFMAKEIIAVDPNNGTLKWRKEHGNRWGQNVAMPVWGEDHYLLYSSPEVGSKGVKLVRNGSKTEVEDLWSTRKIQFYHTTPIRIGDYVYGSSGTMQPCFFSAINVKTGKIAWRKRGFSNATSIYADGHFIILDEDGNLAIATASPEDFVVHSKAKVLDKVSWTVPTLVGHTLYLRDKHKIMALDLG